MSCEGRVIGVPFWGFKILWEASMSNCASNTAALLKGTCTAIWSPSKSALKAVVTNGCSCIALPSINFGWNAWIDKRCNVGARFSNMGWPLKIFSRISQITASFLSTSFLADLTVLTIPLSISLRIMNGLNNSAAISFGNPHSCNFNSGPTTITERPE